MNQPATIRREYDDTLRGRLERLGIPWDYWTHCARILIQVSQRAKCQDVPNDNELAGYVIAFHREGFTPKDVIEAGAESVLQWKSVGKMPLPAKLVEWGLPHKKRRQMVEDARRPRLPHGGPTMEERNEARKMLREVAGELFGQGFVDQLDKKNGAPV